MTIDERLQYLLQSTESLHASMHEITELTQANAKAIGELIALVRSHETRLSFLEEKDE